MTNEMINETTTEIMKPYAPRKRVQVKFTKPSLTKQSFKQEADINSIIARWRKTGIIDHLNPSQPRYGDFSNIPSYDEALNTVIAAESAFMTLPARVRKRFDNDPGYFLEFVQDPKNASELVELGLVDVPSAPLQDEEPDAPSEGLNGSE
ncbi:MAG: hypothetical protein QXJ97_11255 [Desulfurococcaceae archaeon]